MIDNGKSLSQDDDDEGGEAFDLSKMDREGEDDMAGVKVHEIKFDEYGIMDDGVDDSTADKLKAAGVSEGGALIHEPPHRYCLRGRHETGFDILLSCLLRNTQNNLHR